MQFRATPPELKILYISDSLGTPIHPRGIFNFSLSLVEILTEMGARVDLVVEGGSGFGLEGRFGALADEAPDAVNAVRLAEVHRYFSFGVFRFRWNFTSRRYRMMFALARPWLRLGLALRDLFARRDATPVENDTGQVDFVPEKSQHLNLFRFLIVKRGFYSSSMSRANLGMAPPVLDAAGYDLAIVDTPHFIRIEGIGPERIVAVLHDLIPLRDPTMDASWRYLFMRKLEATLAMRAHLAFVSRHTQREFRAAFPRHAGPREFILYPAIRQALMRELERTRAPHARAVPLPAVAVASPRESDPPPARKSKKPKRDRAPPWGFDPALPYFVSVASDEPRKNIATIVRAFNSGLRGRANVVILGDIDARRYHPGLDGNVYFPGYVGETDKLAFFRNAHGAVFASLSEGFGIPIVEGAVMGLPVICSDIDVFREVAGENAIYFDPRSPASLAGAVEEALDDPEAARARATALRQWSLARFSQAAVGAHVRIALAEIGVAL
jgi:glycosyltransferase involved in cell wall biosynthesis